jgi:hypothetical protein
MAGPFCHRRASELMIEANGEADAPRRDDLIWLALAY